MVDCPRAGKWFGCKFEGRYDLSAAELPPTKGCNFSLRGFQQFLDARRDKTYVRDVCVRCGRTIERDG